ncbi:MAG: class I SAM-dependent rRNA methyltransferase [Ignavibacteriales bacterium]|nr:class I SAM-dependent rRNA methyltransferase [Ignavibacteriales bacterium]
MPIVKLQKGREKSFNRKHPWIFSGAVDSIKDVNKNGETVKIISGDGKILGSGSYSSHSQISVRVLSFNPDETVDRKFIQKRIENAIQFRKQIIDDVSTNAYRIINAECDFLPGVIVDKYADFLVCQFLSAGSEFWKKEIVAILINKLNPTGIFERSDVTVREKEGLQQSKGILYGKEPEGLIEIIENGNKFFVDIVNGHKTGFYLDQRDNRKLLEKFSVENEILNCFSFTGGFSVYALIAGASKVTNVDSSEEALLLAERNFSLNGIDSSKYENVNGDVFKYLRKLRDADKQFDVIILDPPKFAESVSQVEKASRGYKDINLLALKLLKKNGTLFTFSCSGHIVSELFNKIIADAAADSGREVHILKYLTQSPDHTMLTSFPEGLYLKGIVCKVN